MLGLAGAPSSPAQAADLVYASGPGGAFTTYTVPVLVMQAGDAVTYANFDIAQHDVVADGVYGPDTNSWCGPSDPNQPEGPLNPRTYRLGECPKVWSELIGIAQTTPILGLDQLVPGEQVPFTCTLHGWMKGTIVVLPA